MKKFLHKDVLFRNYSDSKAGLFPEDPYSAPEYCKKDFFETKNGIGPGSASTALRDERDFYYNETEAVITSGKAETHWHFKRRQGSNALPMLTVDSKIRQLPLEYSFTVRNISSEPVTLVMMLDEIRYNTPGRGFSARAVTVLPGEQRLLTFDFSAQALSVELLPVLFNSIRIYVENRESEIDYNLFFSGFEVHNRISLKPCNTRISLSCPDVFAGNEVEIILECTPDFSVSDDFTLELSQYGFVYSRIRLTDEEKESLYHDGCITLQYKIHPLIPDGDYSVIPIYNGYRIKDSVYGQLHISNKQYVYPTVERKTDLGVPAVFVNGEKLPYSGFATYDYTPGVAYQFGQAESNVYIVPANAAAHIYRHVSSPVKSSTGEYTYGAIDEAVMFSLQSNENAFIVLRLGLNMPDIWLREHPDSIALGTKDGKNYYRASEFVGTDNISYSSEEWISAQLCEVERLFTYIKTRPWCSRVIGVFLAGGCTEEWFAWFSNTARLWGDFSPVNKKAFIEWCGNHPQLCNTDTAHVPLPSERINPGYTIKPVTENSRLSAAYTRFINELTADVICTFAEKIKNITSGNILCGALFGYLLQLAGEPRQTQSGTLGFERYINNGNIDFISGIPLLNFRDPASGYDCVTTAARSVQSAGKLFINENDEILWLVDGRGYGKYKKDDETKGCLDMLKSTFAFDTVYGNPRQYFDLFATWHHDTRVMKQLEQFSAIQKKLLNCDRTPEEKIAFIVDETSFLWAEESSEYLKTQINEMLRTVGRTGAAVGVRTLDDLNSLPQDIRLCIVATSYAALPKNLKKLTDYMNKTSATVVLFGPCGFINPLTGSCDSEACGKLTGFDIITEYEIMPETQGILRIDGESVSSAFVQQNPVCIAGGGNTGGLGDECLGNTRTLPGGGKLIWFSVPLTSVFAWKKIVYSAGITPVTECESYVHECKDIISVTCSESGSIKLRFDEELTLTDVFTGLSFTGKETVCDFYTGQTRLFLKHRKK